MPQRTTAHHSAQDPPFDVQELTATSWAHDTAQHAFGRRAKVLLDGKSAKTKKSGKASLHAPHGAGTYLAKASVAGYVGCSVHVHVS